MVINYIIGEFKQNTSKYYLLIDTDGLLYWDGVERVHYTNEGFYRIYSNELLMVDMKFYEEPEPSEL